MFKTQIVENITGEIYLNYGLFENFHRLPLFMPTDQINFPSDVYSGEIVQQFVWKKDIFRFVLFNKKG